MTDTNDEQLKQQYMQLRSLDEKMRDIEKELMHLDSQFNQIEQIKKWIDEISNCSNKDALVPISDGIFIKANLSETNKFLVNVGSNVIVPKDKSQTLAMLEEQSLQLTNYKDQLSNHLVYLDSMAQKIEQDFLKKTD